MPRTYEPIASQTLSSAAATVTFSNLPSTYTDLVAVFSQVRDSSAWQGTMWINGDTNNNYGLTMMYGTGSTAASLRYTNLNKLQIDTIGTNGNTQPSVGVINLMSYANTNVFKAALIGYASPSNEVARVIGVWRSTSAITSLTFSSNGNINSGSTFSLYGIKAA